jgi:outer membrane immunogenic protein
MKKILLGSVATGALVAAGSASAADLGPRPVYKTPPPAAAPVPVFSWTGCFVGAHGGWGWGRKEVREVLVASFASHSASRSNSIDTDGAIFGGQIGCDYQFWGNWVIGIQGDFAGARITGDQNLGTTPFGVASTDAGITHVRTDWLASVTGRIGWTGWLPRTLFYIRGGGAWVRDKFDFISVNGNNDEFFATGTQTRSGWTIGGGIEYALAPNWSIFAEFNHYDFGNKTVARFLSTRSVTTFDAKQRIEAVRVGVNYRFNWLFGKTPAPVVARY